MVLPPPRRPGAYAIALVCLGNICRSPTAHVVLDARLAEAGLDDRVAVHSSGTGDWHVGNPMDRRAATTLSAAGPTEPHPPSSDASWPTPTLVLAMDLGNLADVGGRSPGRTLPRLRPGQPGSGADLTRGKDGCPRC
jgi:protein-tyrosine phosphatase